MNELIKLWVSVTKGKEIEEFESDVQKLYDYTMNLQEQVNKQQEIINKALKILENFDAYLEPQDGMKIRRCIKTLSGVSDE